MADRLNIYRLALAVLLPLAFLCLILWTLPPPSIMWNNNPYQQQQGSWQMPAPNSGGFRSALSALNAIITKPDDANTTPYTPSINIDALGTYYWRPS